MGKLINIDYAIIETLKAHPEFTPQMNGIYLDNLTSTTGIKLNNFTSKNNARKLMKQVSQKDLLQFILEEAVKCAYSISNDGDTILLSPACASWDQFEDFEARGRKFKEVIGSLAEQ
jgi:hypothetical protein